MTLKVIENLFVKSISFDYCISIFNITYSLLGFIFLNSLFLNKIPFTNLRLFTISSLNVIFRNNYNYVWEIIGIFMISNEY